MFLNADDAIKSTLCYAWNVLLAYKYVLKILVVYLVVHVDPNYPFTYSNVTSTKLCKANHPYQIKERFTFIGSTQLGVKHTCVSISALLLFTYFSWILERSCVWQGQIEKIHRKMDGYLKESGAIFECQLHDHIVSRDRYSMTAFHKDSYITYMRLPMFCTAALPSTFAVVPNSDSSERV